MDLTLHLTEACNLRCQYCYHPKSLKTMTEETLRSALALSGPSDRAAVSFCGGEPLLARSLILEAFAECDRIRRDTGRHFTFQMTTNGTLLDEEFLQIARERGMIIALSYDGLAQDRNRRAAGGEGTAALVESKIPLLLQYLPYAPVMMTVSPACADLLADSVRRFVEADGFRYVLFNPAFGPGISWTERDLAVLAEQYRHLGELYITWHRRGGRSGWVLSRARSTPISTVFPPAPAPAPWGPTDSPWRRTAACIPAFSSWETRPTRWATSGAASTKRPGSASRRLSRLRPPAEPAPSGSGAATAAAA